MKISLGPEIERFIAERVSSGRYHSAEEVVREGLLLLQARESTMVIRPRITRPASLERSRPSPTMCRRRIGKTYQLISRKTLIAIFTAARSHPDGSSIC
jgi:putative addiction module CopG family antidote